MSEYFPEPKSLGERIKVELYQPEYATKTDLKNLTGVDISPFAKKVGLANLKSGVDQLDIDQLKNVPTNRNNLNTKVNKLDLDKLVPVPADQSKLSDVVKNNVVKKDVYNANIKSIEDKISDITNLTVKASLKAKINQITCEIPNTTNLATATSLTAVENKIPSVNTLVKKTDYNITIN